MKTWLFWDWWHIEHQDNLELCQGEPEWVPEATYEDPTLDYLGSIPAVYRDTTWGQWRMLYPGSGYPLTLMGAESDDGVHWHPMNRPDVQPPGEKYAPNHLFTVESASGGPVYIDPVAKDDRPFKLYCVQRGGPAAKRAQLQQDSYFHEVVKGEGVKPWMAENRIATSEDGLNWRLEEDANWTFPQWHPDTPASCFYNGDLGLYTLVTRPGHGDRRVATLTSDDALNWSNLQLAMQPDPMDPPQTQFYSMPTWPYEGNFVGFLWIAHFSNSRRLDRFNQLWGTIDSQITYSLDGVHFQRGFRRPFMRLNEPGLPGSGVIYPTCLVQTDQELRIYSSATRDLHHQNANAQFLRKGESPPAAVIMHTLRKDGFNYLASKGNWADLITKPLVLKMPELQMNALAPYGEVTFQLTDLVSRPIEGFTFGDCIPFRTDDRLDWQVRWEGKTLDEVVGRVIRLEMQFRHARIFALRGDFHFADALDVALIEDGKKIDTTLFDF